MFATTVTAWARSHPSITVAPRRTEYAAPNRAFTVHDAPRSGRWQGLISASSRARTSISASCETRVLCGAGPRSVHSTGTVMLDPWPVSTTSIRRPPRFMEYRTSTVRPASGWNGCVTVSEPEYCLDETAVCRLRPHGP